MLQLTDQQIANANQHRRFVRDPDGAEGRITGLVGNEYVITWVDGATQRISSSALEAAEREHSAELTQRRREMGRKLHTDMDAIRRGESVLRDDALAVIREWQRGGHSIPLTVRAAGAPCTETPRQRVNRLHAGLSTRADEVIAAHHRQAEAKAKADTGAGRRGADYKAGVEAQVLQFVKAGRRAPD